MTDEIDFSKKDTKKIESEVDKVLQEKKKEQEKPTEMIPVVEEEVDRVSFAHEIKNNPPEKGYMKVDIIPAIYSIDLNIDAHWWFNHVCTVFPLLLDQSKRTHIDLKDSFKEQKRLPDFNYMFIFILFIGLVGIIAVTKLFGWW